MGWLEFGLLILGMLALIVTGHILSEWQDRRFEQQLIRGYNHATTGLLKEALMVLKNTKQLQYNVHLDSGDRRLMTELCTMLPIAIRMYVAEVKKQPKVGDSQYTLWYKKSTLKKQLDHLIITYQACLMSYPDLWTGGTNQTANDQS